MEDVHNVGEVVLNAAQQQNLAGQLIDMGGIVSGEMIRLGINNYVKRTGKGEVGK